MNTVDIKGVAAWPDDQPNRSTEASIREVIKDLTNELGVGPTLHSYCTEARAFLSLLGPRVAALPPRELSLTDMQRIVNARLRHLDPQFSSPRQSLRMLRWLLSRIPGIPEECIMALRTPRRSQRSRKS
jgi:hypothetical protein